jgi:hypothetical protein
LYSCYQLIIRILIVLLGALTPFCRATPYNDFAEKDENPELPGLKWDYNFSELTGIAKVSITIFNESFNCMEN